MAVKTRAALKAENANDFPDNSARLISPADLRGQMDDIVDSAVFPEDGGGGGGGGGVHFVSTVAQMRAIPGLTAGTVVFVGPQADQFVVVDDATLGTDGGTVFIPDSELSAVVSEVIPGSYWDTDVLKEYALAHTGIDFESFELVVSDPNALFPVTGEIIDIWTIMHGHVMNPGVNPYTIPKLKTAEGKFLDPYARLTLWLGPPDNPSFVHPPLRTGGALARYKYATSGLRLKRITGLVFQLRWWPVIAVEDEAPGVQTDNTGKICWCINAAVKAGAEAVVVDKMYHYQSTVELQHGIELRGRGPGLSGFRVMDNGQHRELLLSTSVDAIPDPAAAPWQRPATRAWVYHANFFDNCPTFFWASNATRMRISGIEFDGNIENNMQLFMQQNAAYAFTYASNTVHLFNSTTAGAFVVTNASGRVIPTGSVLELHNVKMHGYCHLLLGNYNCQVISTGVLELGNCITGHWTYLADGVFDTIKCFGYTMGGGLRCRKLVAKHVEMALQPHPDVMFTLAGSTYLPRTMNLVTSNFVPQSQSIQAAQYFPYPELERHQVVIDNLTIDATGLDNWPSAYTYEGAQPFLMASDHIHIKTGKIRFGNKMTAVTTLWGTGENQSGIVPFRNIQFENLLVEYGSRKGLTLAGLVAGGSGVSQVEFRNITLEQRTAAHMPGDPNPGTGLLLGAWDFREVLPTDPAGSSFFDGRIIEFSAVAADATLNGKYIDITPPDTGAPLYRLWFNYNSAGSAPAAGGKTLVEVPVSATAPTTAKVSAAFAAAIEGTVASPGVPSTYLTGVAFGTHTVIGSFSHWHGTDNSGYVTADLANATGVTQSLRAHRRHYSPALISFERFIAPAPVYSYLVNFISIGTHREIRLSFKDCILGAWTGSYIICGSGSLGNATAFAAKDKLNFSFEDTVFDLRDGMTWSNMDLMLYAGHYRNCRVRTPTTIRAAGFDAGLTSLGTGFEVLLSEESGVETWTPAGETTHDIVTKMFWVPKPGNIRLYPANAATAALWNTVTPEWRRRNVAGVSTALGGGGQYYQGIAAINEDWRAPFLRLNFSSAPVSGTPLSFGWSAAVSP